MTDENQLSFEPGILGVIRRLVEISDGLARQLDSEIAVNISHLPKAPPTHLTTETGVNRPGIAGGTNSGEVGVMTRAKTYSPEVRERAVWMVFEHESEYTSQWAAIQSIAEKMGCSNETLRNWVRQAERDQGCRAGLTTEEHARLKELEREVRELRRANEILRKASITKATWSGFVIDAFSRRIVGWRISTSLRQSRIGRVQRSLARRSAR